MRKGLGRGAFICGVRRSIDSATSVEALCVAGAVTCKLCSRDRQTFSAQLHTPWQLCSLVWLHNSQPQALLILLCAPSLHASYLKPCAPGRGLTPSWHGCRAEEPAVALHHARLCQRLPSHADDQHLAGRRGHAGACPGLRCCLLLSSSTACCVGSRLVLGGAAPGCNAVTQLCKVVQRTSRDTRAADTPDGARRYRAASGSQIAGTQMPPLCWGPEAWPGCLWHSTDEPRSTFSPHVSRCAPGTAQLSELVICTGCRQPWCWLGCRKHCV